MLLNSVVIVLREVLEASVVLAALLACCRLRNQSIGWSKFAVVAGLGFAWLYGSSMYFISELAGGVGQELANAGFQLLAFTCLLLCVYKLASPPENEDVTETGLIGVMAIVLLVLVAREGAEIYIYIYGFSGSDKFLDDVIPGGIVGAAIGFSVGALLYYFLLSLSKRWALNIALLLLIVMSAGMIRQAVQMLIQADILSGSAPLWDTSVLLNEQSVLGQLHILCVIVLLHIFCKKALT